MTSSGGNFVVFIDDKITSSEARYTYRELTTEPLQPFWRKFFADHFSKRGSYRLPTSIKSDEEFSEFFEKIMNNKKHVITECFERYKRHFKKIFLVSTQMKIKESTENFREFILCFAIFLAKKWGVKISFFKIMYRKIAKFSTDVMYPILIGLYSCTPRNRELSVIMNKLEGLDLELKELGVADISKVNFEKAWKVLKKVTKSQDIVSLSEILNYFYYNVFQCIDETFKGKGKIKVKDVDLSKIILCSIIRAEISQANVHVIVNLLNDFCRGIINDQDFLVIKLIHNIFGWIRSSVKVERQEDIKRYKQRTFVGGQGRTNTFAKTPERKKAGPFGEDRRPDSMIPVSSFDGGDKGGPMSLPPRNIKKEGKRKRVKKLPTFNRDPREYQKRLMMKKKNKK